MDRTERFYKIDQLLSEHRAVPLSVLMDKLEVSRATLKRDLEYMRTRLNAPIIWDREAGGYRFEVPAKAGPKYELPGLWFSAREIHALLTMQHLLNNLGGGGLLGVQIVPLQQRLRSLLGSADASADEVAKRVRIINPAQRQLAETHFSQLGSALLKRKRAIITYRARSSDVETRREISPQRLVYYRGNWYLDAWCHLREGLRSFSVDCVMRVETLATPARNVAVARLDTLLGAGYGIFSGETIHWAELLFSPERARWVSGEQWHPAQEARFEADGSYYLKLPYADDRELVMDILRHGAEVAVLAPMALRQRVADELARASIRYALSG